MDSTDASTKFEANDVCVYTEYSDTGGVHFMASCGLIKKFIREHELPDICEDCGRQIVVRVSTS